MIPQITFILPTLVIIDLIFVIFLFLLTVLPVVEEAHTKFGWTTLMFACKGCYSSSSVKR